jgi:DNA-binding transcriptional LysR family regulator
LVPAISFPLLSEWASEIDVDLNSLVIFAKVIEASSFSEAARRLSMPVATVSRRIAELEDQLGVGLLERSTRSLRLTDVGSEVLTHARRTVELRDTVNGIVSNHTANVSGVLRLCAPPNMDALLTPLVCAFQASYPEVRVHVLITTENVDRIDDGIDLMFRLGPLENSSLIARRILTYRHRLVASPSYMAKHQAPEDPVELLDHQLIAFSEGRCKESWEFVNSSGTHAETLTFSPHLSMIDFARLTPALLAGAGIGDLSPLVQPELLRDGKLVEVMPSWRFRARDLSLLHSGGPHVSRALRLFKAFAAQVAPTLFPSLPA